MNREHRELGAGLIHAFLSSRLDDSHRGIYRRIKDSPDQTVRIACEILSELLESYEGDVASIEKDEWDRLERVRLALLANENIIRHKPHRFDRVHAFAIVSFAAYAISVFVVGFSKGLLPHARSSDFAEERRMAYVAVTRAEDRLYLSSFAHRFNGVMEPSPFLYEMELLQDQEAEDAIEVPFEPGTGQGIRVLEKEVVNE